MSPSTSPSSREIGSPGFPVRRPRDTLSSGIPRYWFGGDPFRTHFLNALSSTFPFGEAFFVRSVLRYAERIEDPALQAEIRSFAAQEGQHRRFHEDHVRMLVEQGYPAIATRNQLAERGLRWQERRMPKFSLALTAVLEHKTAILARRLLSDPASWTETMHPEMARLWRWHALEESEHKAVAFDVLERVAPSHARRVAAMVFNSLMLAIEVLDRLAYLLWKDGLLFRPSIWTNGLRGLFGRGGLLRGTGADYRAWMRRDFHPADIDDRALLARSAPQIELELAR